ncbi:MAG: hypothetical protein WBQ34_05280 [Candidatus Acidiferrales bacterium]
MPRRGRPATVKSAVLIAITLLCGGLWACRIASAQTASNANRFPSSPPVTGPPANHYVSAQPRGTKLMLKDGSYELVREYEIQGDRVRYYSIDRSQWEVIPAAIVNWDATKKREAEEEKSQASLLAKVKKQEDEHDALPALDIDASLELTPGVFLPPGDGLFVFDGKSVLQIPQAQTDSQISKTHLLERVLVPVPIIPSRKMISIPGEHAKFRVNTGQPEFYLRTADARTPDVELIRAKISHGKRHIMNLDELMGDQHATSNTLPMQQWVIAKDVYRYTLGEKLPRGEYVIAEILPNEGMSLYVWDFGVN